MLFAVLLLVAFVVVGLVFYFKKSKGQNQATRRRYRREPDIQREQAIDETLDSNEALGLSSSKISSATQEKIRSIDEDAVAPEYVMLHVIAPTEYSFGGYELLQALLSNGLRFGDRNIFHRHETKTGRGRILFSLATINKPGTFELSKMGSFTCPGLVLFLILGKMSDSMLAFDTMLETARQLSEDLGGEVWDEQKQILNMDKVAQIRSRIRRFEEAQRTPDFFDEPQLES